MSEATHNLFVLTVAALIAAGCGREAVTTVTVETDPAAAAVWRDEKIVGTSPVQLIVPRGGTIDIRVSHPSCEEWAASVSTAMES